MCNSTSEKLFRVRYLFLNKDGSSNKVVHYVHSVPSRRAIIFSALDHVDDDSNLIDVHISVESVPYRGGSSVEIANIKFCCLCKKL